MELQARVTALEEEVGILKGEIKAILQEVRIAVLARQNPFMERDDAPESGGPASAPTPVVLYESQPAAAPTAGPAAPQAVTQPGPGATQAQMASQATADPTPLRPNTRAQEQEQPLDFDALLPPRPDREQQQTPLDLAALLSWVQESTQSFSASDFAMLVRIGTYGDLIEEGLEQTLLELAEDLPSKEDHKASLGDFTLALQKLGALREYAPGRPAQRRHSAA